MTELITGRIGVIAKEKGQWQAGSGAPILLGFYFHLCVLTLGMNWLWVRSSDAAIPP